MFKIKKIKPMITKPEVRWIEKRSNTFVPYSTFAQVLFGKASPSLMSRISQEELKQAYQQQRKKRTHNRCCETDKAGVNTPRKIIFK